MTPTTMRLGLSLMVMLGLWGGRLGAQQEVFVAPTVPYIPDHHEQYPAPFYVKPVPPPAKHVYKRVMNHFYMGCQADPWGATGNFHSEAQWLFGSSRSWFFDGCWPYQPCVDKRMQR